MDLGKKIKNSFGEFLCLSFAVTRLKIGPIEKMQKTTLKLHKTASPALGNPPGSILNVIISRKLSNTVYRIEIGFVETKDKIW